MQKDRKYNIDTHFLDRYSDAAIENAEDLLIDAKILLERESYARAYFLAVASIEETGKAYLAFSCKKRNLSNNGLNKRIKEIFEKHSQKINAAFTGWIAQAENKKQVVDKSLELILHLNLGREKSMYVDANPDNSISIPMRVIRPVAARDSVRLADDCLNQTKYYLAHNEPPSFTAFDDKFFCLRTEKITAMTKRADFGAYLLDMITKDGINFSFSKAIVTYHDKYFCRKISFNEKDC